MIQQQLSTGQFKSVDEVLTTALAYLPHRRPSNRLAVQRMLEFSGRHSVKLPEGETVEGLVHENRIRS
jgi:hypothetical protein